MKMGLIFLLCLFLPGLAISNPTKTEQSVDYCYKPNKPLLFSKQQYKQRYEQDLQEYQRCVKSFKEVHDNISNMRRESEKNSDKIMNNFVNQ